MFFRLLCRQCQDEGHEPHPACVHGKDQDELAGGADVLAKPGGKSHRREGRYHLKECIQERSILQAGHQQGGEHHPKDGHAGDGESLENGVIPHPAAEDFTFAATPDYLGNVQKDQGKGGGLDAATSGCRAGPDEHQQDDEDHGRNPQGVQIDGVEPRRTGLTDCMKLAQNASLPERLPNVPGLCPSRKAITTVPYHDEGLPWR